MKKEKSQFCTLATLYDDMVAWPFRQEIEIPTVLEHLGDISGLSILDFGCGSGYYTRLLKSKGAKRVVGYDIAGGMLKHACEKELEHPLGIEYTSTLDSLENEFDLVLGVYVLPYADHYEKLQSMVNSMVKLLRVGGRFLTLPLNPQYAIEQDYYTSYGFNLTSNTAYKEGSKVYLHLPHHNDFITITAWYWSRFTLNKVFEEAGLRNIQWHFPQLSNSPPSVDLILYLRKPHTMLVSGYYTGNQ